MAYIQAVGGSSPSHSTMSKFIERYVCINLRKDYHSASIVIWQAGFLYIAHLYVYIKEWHVRAGRATNDYPYTFTSRNKQKAFNYAKYYFNKECQNKKWGNDYKPSKWKLELPK